MTEIPANDPLIQVAENLDASLAQLPFVSELLSDLWSLGSSPERIVDLLRPLGLPEGARVLDLACGKGAVAIHLAVELGFRVRGVDLFEPFIQDAVRRAFACGVGAQCDFEVADLHREVERAEDYAVVVYASVDALGPFDECIRKLRTTVRPGGYVVVDDGFLIDSAGRAEESRSARGDAPARAGGHPHSHGEVVAQLESCGDRIVGEVRLPRDEIRRLNRTSTELIARRARQMVQEHPERKELIDAYVSQQAEEARFQSEFCQSAVWLVRRGD